MTSLLCKNVLETAGNNLMIRSLAKNDMDGSFCKSPSLNVLLTQKICQATKHLGMCSQQIRLPVVGKSAGRSHGLAIVERFTDLQLFFTFSKRSRGKGSGHGLCVLQKALRDSELCSFLRKSFF